MRAAFFLLIVACVPFLPSGATVPRWAILSVVAAIALYRTPITWPGMLLIAYLTGMAALGPVTYEALYIWWHFLIIAVLFAYFLTRDIRSVIIGAGLGLWVNSSVVIAQWGWGWEKIPQVIPNSGLFYNHNMGAEAAAITLAVAVGYRLWWLIPGIVPTLAFGSRAPVVALGIAGGLALWRWSRFAAMMTTLGGMLIAVAVMKAEGGHRMVFFSPDLVQRIGVWMDTIPHLTVLGHGLGSFLVNYPLYQHHSIGLQLRFENAHNDYLQVVYELGIGGLALIAVLLARTLAASPSPARYGMIVFLVEACFGFPLYEPVSAALAACCAARLFSDCRSLRDFVPARRSRICRRVEDYGLAPVRAGVPHLSLDALPSFWSRLRGNSGHVS